jgi:hypothetical protein
MTALAQLGHPGDRGQPGVSIIILFFFVADSAAPKASVFTPLQAFLAWS